MGGLNDPDSSQSALIGCLLICDSEEARRIATTVQSEWFTNKRLRAVWDILKEPCRRSQPVSLAVAVDLLKGSTDLAEYDSVSNTYEALLAQAIEDAGICTSWPEYAKQVRMGHARKAIITALDEAAIETTSAGSADEAIDNTIGKIVATAHSLPSASWEDSPAIEPMLGAFYDTYNEELEAIPFPQPELNTMGGMRKGNMVFVAAYSGQGKSWMCLDMMLHAASLGHKCAYFTLEVTKHELIERMIAMQTYTSLREISMKQAPYETILKGLGSIKQLPIDIYDGSTSLERVITAQLRNQYKIIFIDHLGLMRIHGKQTHRLNLDHTLEAMKGFATKHGIIFVIASQFSRPETKTGKIPKPTMYMMKESGGIEQIADYIIMVNKNVEMESGYERECYTMWTAKQRLGIAAREFQVTDLHERTGFRFRGF